MKKWKNYLLSILAVAGFVACSDDDPGMPPVVDGNDVSVEIKRDTADVYKISLPITSEEGLSKVSLIDNATNKAIDEQTSFSNPNNHTYTYDFDLTPYTDNTVVMLTLKIEDKAGQIVNKKITLTVKKFSELDVRFATEGTITTCYENCNIKLTVVRGLIPLKELQVYVGENLSNSFDLSVDPEQSKYDFNVRVKGLQNGDNTVKVVVIDNKDQKFDKLITINRTEQKKWQDLRKAIFNESLEVSFNVGDMNGDFIVDHPDEDNNIYAVTSLYMSPDMSTMKTNVFEFEYNENKMVSKVIYLNQVLSMMAGSFIETRIDYNYTYGDNDQVIKVSKVVEGTESDYITDIVYESGTIKSYKIEGREYTPQYIEKEGEMIRVDHLDAALSGYTYDFSDKFGNPMYLDKLPALVPFEFEGFQFSQYLYNPYLFDQLKDGSTVKQSYTISNIVDQEQYITWDEDGTECSVNYSYYN